MENIGIYHKCDVRIEKSVPRFAVWHHEACRVMTNGDLEGRIFLSTLTQIVDTWLSSGTKDQNFDRSFHRRPYFCTRAVKALARLLICTGASEFFAARTWDHCKIS